MRRTILFLTTFFVILGSGTWFGVAVAQNDSQAKAGDDKPGLEGWKYPGAKELASGEGAGGYYAVLATTDGLDKVEAFYGKKVGEKLTPDHAGGSGIGGETGTGGKATEAHAFADDSVQPGAKSESRPVVVRVLVQRTKAHDLTLVISKAQGEDYTHISLTYFPR